MVFLAQIVGSVLVFVYYPIALDEAQTSVIRYDEENSTSVREGWDKIQGVVRIVSGTYKLP